MKKIYRAFCKFEEIFCVTMLAGIALLVFVSALTRTFGHPINWAQDAALVAFAWMIFFGSDVAVRGPGLIGINMLIRYFPKAMQKWLDIIFKIIIVIFLVVLVIYGVEMVATGYQRQINTLHISYAWVTASVPTGAFFMIISTVTRMIESIKTPSEKWGQN